MNVIERIESGKLKIEITQPVCDMNDIIGLVKVHNGATTELLRLAKIGQQMQWVPVTPETMPPRNKKMFIYTKNDIYIAADDGEKWNIICGDNPVKSVADILYWMPIPPLPEVPE